MRYLFSKIFLCDTHKRFKKVFSKLEREAFDLSNRLDVCQPDVFLFIRQIKRNQKNFAKTLNLYREFSGQDYERT